MIEAIEIKNNIKRETYTKIAPINKISSVMKNEMFSLFSKYYENTNIHNFLYDFNEKDWCIIVYNKTNDIIGFSTIKLLSIKFENEERIILFSGDTIVDKKYWHSNSLVCGFGNFMIYLINNYKHIYWLLTSKGISTYRLLQLYFKEFYPVYHTPTPLWYQTFIDTISFQKYNSDYDKSRGIIKSNKKNNYLKNEMAKIPVEKLKNPHISFFLNKNPNYKYGEELVCLSEISHSNLTDIAYKIIKSNEIFWEKDER